MVAVRFLLCVFCAGLGYWGWCFTSGVVGYGIASQARNDERPSGRRAPRKDDRGEHSAGAKDRRAERSDGGEGKGAADVLRAAQAEIGVQEVGANTGPRVDQYGACVGIKKQAWCAAFVSFCFAKAGYAAPRTPWSPALFPAKRSVKEPKPGLVMGLYFPSLGRVAHCGIVEQLKGNWLISIEGNTSAGSSGGGNNEREGDGVWRKTRHRRTIHCYANWL